VAGKLPRVLLVGPMPPTQGGVTTFMLNLMASSLRHEFRFVPFTTSRPPKRDVTDNWGYGAMLRGGAGRICAGVAITLWHLAKFPAAVVGGGIDLVQIQACDYQVFWESALYACMARLLRRRVLFRIGGAFDVFHGTAGRLEKRLIRAALCLPHVVIAQSAFARDYVRGAGRQGEIVPLPNWTALSPARLRRNGTPLCLFIAGQEARRKGVEQVLAAAGLLQAQGCAVRFLVLAAPPALAARIAASTLAGMMDVRGPVPHGAVLEAMRACDIFLLPSHGEGFPNALLEAAACGMACIATPVGAVPEIAADGAVMLVPVGDAASLASAISQLAGAPETRCVMGEAARQAVRTRYCEAAALPALRQCYLRLLQP
jgi:glycosyltransferase involved in cell wall biosynthesis